MSANSAPRPRGHACSRARASACSLIPLKVEDSQGLVAVSLGERHGCSLDGDGRVRCWGANEYGQLGIGSLDDASSPQLVGDGYVSVASGFFNTCALREGGALDCFGDNSNDQFGTPLDSSTTPVAVTPDRSWESVSSGRSVPARSKRKQASVIVGVLQRLPAPRRRRPLFRYKCCNTLIRMWYLEKDGAFEAALRAARCGVRRGARGRGDSR